MIFRLFYDINSAKQSYSLIQHYNSFSINKETVTTLIIMKTHMNNTKAKQIYVNYDGKNTFANHQFTMHTQKIKPAVETRRKQQIRIVGNNKVQINSQPFQHVNKLFKNIITNNYKSSIDNKAPQCYAKGKKILKDRIKKNPKENYIKQQHEKQLRSQMERVKNCKSLAQRKKDNTDPIVNPTYFMKQGSEAKSVTIEQYKSKILKKNRPASGNVQVRKQLQARLYQATKVPEQQGAPEMPKYQNFGSVPNFSKKTGDRAKSAGYNRQQTKYKSTAGDDLPACTFKSILGHIIDNKMYKDADLKVLYVRLCHKYGDELVDQIWEYLMEELQR